MAAMVRPTSSDTEPSDLEDDPLVELARIVSGRAPAEEPRRRPVFDEPVSSEADLARDLEAELLSDLQATFAAAGDEPEPIDDPIEDPPFYSAEETEAAAAEQFPFEREEPPPALDPDTVPSDEDALASLTEDRFFDEPAAAEEAQYAPPVQSGPASGAPSSEPAFESMALRGNPGPAFDPGALRTGQPPMAEQPVAPAAPPQPSVDWYPESDPGLAEPQPDPAESLDPAGPTEFEPQPDTTPSGVAPVPAQPPKRHRDPRLERDPFGEARLAARRRSGRRFYSIVAILTIVALGTAAVLVLGGGNPSDSDAPLITADADPVRVFPEPEVETPEPGGAVFDRISDENDGPAETLLEGAEPVADLETSPEDNDGITQILAQDGNAGAAGFDPEPRRVRTVTVSPDGTVVESTTDANATDPAPAAEEGVPVDEAAEAPAARNPLSPNAEPVVTPEPTTEPVQQIEETPQPVADAPDLGAAIAPGFYVQVSAQGSEDAARAQLADFRSAAPSILGSQPAVIQRAELPQGTFFRVQFGPLASQADANQLRAQLLTAGIDAFVTSN